MSRGRVVVLAGLVVCFAAGAIVASRTDPFPPGVEDPGSRPSATVTDAPTVATRWVFTLASATRHDLHVGGSCATSWRLRTTLAEAEGGTFAGDGDAESSEATCTTPTAQIQADSIRLLVSGSQVGPVVRIVVREAGRDPEGARDLGGFANTLPEMGFVFQGMGERGRAVDRVTLSDGNLGTYASTNIATLTCIRGCDTQG